VADARKDILSNLPHQITIKVERRFFGFIVGKGGENIRHLKRKYTVEVEFDQIGDKIMIAGKRGRCEAVSSAIQSLVIDCRVKEAEKEAARRRRATTNAFGS